ncbi:unnamed protein product [Protopolystoma xenopodis]|uniref:Uncharacterized protein n=1 Tax=Protopolystoma xenopodis TaxID=117903 RepID=A0A448WAN5_9PLAT|nr:unnamed protein product [Protopolystoma xenopodis]
MFESVSRAAIRVAKKRVYWQNQLATADFISLDFGSSTRRQRGLRSVGSVESVGSVGWGNVEPRVGCQCPQNANSSFLRGALFCFAFSSAPCGQQEWLCPFGPPCPPPRLHYALTIGVVSSAHYPVASDAAEPPSSGLVLAVSTLVYCTTLSVSSRFTQSENVNMTFRMESPYFVSLATTASAQSDGRTKAPSLLNRTPAADGRMHCSAAVTHSLAERALTWNSSLVWPAQRAHRAVDSDKSSDVKIGRVKLIQLAKRSD